MKKSSKQKKNNRKNSRKQQAKAQRRDQRKLKAKQNDQATDGANGVEPGDVDAVTANQRRKALIARFRQTEWKQRVKAGKASAAKVEKVYNRGG